MNFLSSTSAEIESMLPKLDVAGRSQFSSSVRRGGRAMSNFAVADDDDNSAAADAAADIQKLLLSQYSDVNGIQGFEETLERIKREGTETKKEGKIYKLNQPFFALS